MRGSGRQHWTVSAALALLAARLAAACRSLPVFALAVAAAVLLLGTSLPTAAKTPKVIKIDPKADRIEITNLAIFDESRGDKLPVVTAAGEDGLSARIVVPAVTPGTNPGWLVFALHNPTSQPMQRWLTAARYNIIGSGAIWPDLDARRIEAVTPSLGIVPERVQNDQTDIFRLTIPPGKTVTFVAELAADRTVRDNRSRLESWKTRVYLWKPLGFAQKARDRQLFNGIMLGILGVMGIFLTAVFAANHKAIFPAAALVSWCLLAHLCVEFGFWHKLFQLRPEDNALYRAATEAAVAASLVIFLFIFLRISVWHAFVRMIFAVWIASQLGLIFAAVIDPHLASTFARLSFVAIGALGGLLALFLALRGQDRALSLIPTWMLFAVWIFGAAMALSGRLTGDVAVSGLIAGLVLFVLLLGFTVTQFAFGASEPVYGAAPSQLQLRALAVEGSGSAVWEWNARRDEIKVSSILELMLGLTPGELSAKVSNFLKHLHPADRERLQLSLSAAKDRTSDHIHLDFRMRHTDNSYRWFELESATVPGGDRNALRSVGLMRDITETKRAQERMMHDAVHDSLTGSPNRELFLDRLAVAMSRARIEPGVRPAILFIDIDKFKSVNSSFGLIVGDSLLLSVARRLAKHLGPQDTLGRVGGDQFAVLTVAQLTQHQLAALADDLRNALRSPITIAGQEIILTVSIGISIFDGAQENDRDLLREAEIAMYRAKGFGTDRMEVFDASMRAKKDERIAIESDLRRALERRQLKLLYQPIITLSTEELAGFEALVRWDHPKLGTLNPADFVPVAEETDLIARLGGFVLDRATAEAARWHQELLRETNPLFVSVNVSSRQLFRLDLIHELRQILAKASLPKGTIRLEVTESLVMENPEQATQMLDLLKTAGAELSLDDFGTGYSSLSYLQRFPFDTIKIDRALVQGSGEDGAEPVIVRSIVALAHELGMKVVAEGVETGTDVGFLRSIGCGYAQGFYYGEPMTDREVTQLLRMIRKSEKRKMTARVFGNKGKKKLQVAEPAPATQPPRPATPAEKTQSGRPSTNAAGRPPRTLQPTQQRPQGHGPINGSGNGRAAAPHRGQPGNGAAGVNGGERPNGTTATADGAHPSAPQRPAMQPDQPVRTGGQSGVNGSGSDQPGRRPAPAAPVREVPISEPEDFSTLPPAIAASLARLAGVPVDSKLPGSRAGAEKAPNASQEQKPRTGQSAPEEQSRGPTGKATGPTNGADSAKQAPPPPLPKKRA